MTETTHLSLPFLDAAQARKHVTHNEALQLLDALTQLSVIARDQTSAPASPVEGDRYLVGAGATGAFAGKDGEIAAWLSGGWVFLSPQAGWLTYVAAENRALFHDGSIWRDAGLALAELQNLELLGVGATADASNPFALKANAALFAAKTVAEGGDGDLRIKLSKETSGDTLSHLYQTNYSGRAETGLTGDDDFHVKVSADGATWRDSIRVDRSSGRVSFPSGVGDGSLKGFRNLLRNGRFALNQRAVSGTVNLAAGAYGHDGVKAGASGATYTFSTSGIDTTLTITAGSLIMPIEDGMIEGGDYVLSHAGTAQARIWQGVGYVGSGSYASVPAAGLAVTGLTSTTQTNVEFATGAVLRPQLEPGAYATAFERRPPGVELALCWRYFQRLAGAGGPQAPAVVQGNFMSAPLMSGVEMYAVPTITHNLSDANFSSGAGPSGSQWGLSQAGGSWASKTGTFSIGFMSTRRSLAIRTTGASLSPTPNSLTLGVNLFIDASAEL
jgi:hypothetical protein